MMRYGPSPTRHPTGHPDGQTAWRDYRYDGASTLHATLLETLDTAAVWSVARGLARSADAYKAHLIACDQPRRNRLDGRGNLSEENLAEFTKFFLRICVDQVTFMQGLMQPERLRTRILLWAEEETRLTRLPPKAATVLEAILYRGELLRGDVAALVRHGRAAGASRHLRVD
jgi:hypothetical protein